MAKHPSAAARRAAGLRSEAARYAANARWHGRSFAGRERKAARRSGSTPTQDGRRLPVPRLTGIPGGGMPRGPRTAPPLYTDFFGIKEAAKKVQEHGEFRIELPFYSANTEPGDYNQLDLKREGDEYFEEADDDEGKYWRIAPSEFLVTFSDKIDKQGKHTSATVTLANPDADDLKAGDDDDDDDEGDF
jgi:hypothetical protein